MRFDLLTSDPALELRLRDYFSGYLAHGGAAHAKLWVEALPASLQCPELWDDEDSDFHAQGDTVIQRDFAARRLLPQTPGGPAGALALINGELDDSFHNLLRWFAPRTLLANRCFLLHGAGLVRNGEGYVFFGQSGAGKSTTTGLITANDPATQALGDDAIIIQISEEGHPLLHSAPLGCGYSRAAPPPHSARIAGLFNLRQSSENRIEDLSASQGVAALLASAMNTSASEAADSRFDLATQFAASRCGIQALHFTLSPTFWRLVLAEKSNDSPRRPHDRSAHQEKSRQVQVP